MLVKLNCGLCSVYLVSHKEDPLFPHVYEATHDVDVPQRDFALLCFAKLLHKDDFQLWASRSRNPL